MAAGSIRTTMSSLFDRPPLDPSSSEAQQWVRDELARGGYDTAPSWWQRFVEWLMRVLNGPQGAGLPSWVVAAVVVLLAAVVAVVVLRLVRPEARLNPSTGAGPALDDEGLSAEDYRRRAAQSDQRQDWDAMLLDSYRALAASAVERTLLAELPGRTAHEVAVALEPVFPDHRAALAITAGAFDAVRYGRRAATRQQARDAAELDEVLLRTRPLVEPVVVS